MSIFKFSRLITNTRIPGRRSYSSFFSSKPGGGGGRFFNSAKTLKVVPAKKVNSSIPEASNTKVIASPLENGSRKSTSNVETDTEKCSPSNPTSSQPSSSLLKDAGDEEAPDASSSLRSPDLLFSATRQHPLVNVKDFKLHQFFSLHRPLLLPLNPSTIWQTSSSIFKAEELNKVSDEQTSLRSVWVLDESSEAPDGEADAATARQLSRALILSHAGAAIRWEATLCRLGLDESAPDEVHTELVNNKWLEIRMDSTKRKRRKKMKKHKLKKRRRATRASRMKIGR